jgi:hypothetical protein
MKPTTESKELSAEELRKLSATERCQRFLTWKEKNRVHDAEVLMEQTRWHVVDEDMPLDGFDELPQAWPGDTRTPELWVKFRHPQLNKVVVSRGRFDYDGGTWTARLSPVEDGDVIGHVLALAWAWIAPGERPREGLTIRTHEADPW